MQRAMDAYEAAIDTYDASVDQSDSMKDGTSNSIDALVGLLRSWQAANT